MLHSRRESLHRNGITDLDLLQQTSATKSAQSRHAEGQPRCPLLGVMRTSQALSAHHRRAPASRHGQARHHGITTSSAPPSPAIRTSVRSVQQVAYQSSGNGIKAHPGPLSLAALGIGASRDGERPIKTFRSSGSSVAICGNPLNSARMGRHSLTVDPPPKFRLSKPRAGSPR